MPLTFVQGSIKEAMRLGPFDGILSNMVFQWIKPVSYFLPRLKTDLFSETFFLYYRLQNVWTRSGASILTQFQPGCSSVLMLDLI